MVKVVYLHVIHLLENKEIYPASLPRGASYECFGVNRTKVNRLLSKMAAFGNFFIALSGIE